MAPRRRAPTAESRARAARIAAALEGLLEEVPVDAPTQPDTDPYRPRPAPRPRKANAPALPCPGCGGPMEPVFSLGVDLDRCATCGGMWLDPGELETVVETPDAPSRTPDLAELRTQMGLLPGANATADEVHYRKCPRCRNPMNRRNFGTLSGVIIDECPSHGVYLDPDELEAIETFIMMGGLALQEQSRDERLRRREHRVQVREQEAATASQWTARRHVWWHMFDWFV